MTSRAKHVVICGAGVIGLCSAYYLMRRGHRVTVVDRGAEHGDRCSLGNAGMIVPSHFVPLAAPGVVAQGLKWMFDARSPFYVRPRWSADLAGWGWRFIRAANARHVDRSAPLLRDLQLASRRLFEELADLTGNDFELVRRGLLLLCRTPPALDREAQLAAQANALGVPATVCSPAQAAALDPGVRMEIAGAIHFPLDCHLTPQRFSATLVRLLRAGGATFLWSDEVNGWRHSGGRIDAMVTATAEITADEFLLAGGSWSPGIVRGLGLKLPLQAGKGYSLTLPRPRQLPQLCSIFSEAHVAVTPMGSSLRIGGTMELSGLDDSIQPERVRQIVESVPKYFPEFGPEDFAQIPAWRGLRPCSPDGLPYVGRFGRYANLSVATGHAMLGLSLGPITGRLIAEILSGENPSIGIAALNPDRYA